MIGRRSLESLFAAPALLFAAFAVVPLIALGVTVGVLVPSNFAKFFGAPMPVWIELRGADAITDDGAAGRSLSRSNLAARANQFSTAPVGQFQSISYHAGESIPAP